MSFMFASPHASAIDILRAIAREAPSGFAFTLDHSADCLEGYEEQDKELDEAKDKIQLLEDQLEQAKSDAEDELNDLRVAYQDLEHKLEALKETPTAT